MKKVSFRNDILPMKNNLYRLALRITCNSAEAEDVVQDTLIKVWNRRERWDEIESMEAFCMTICRNLALDKIKKMGNQHDSLDDNRFGHNRSETFDDYVRYGKEMGIEVVQNTALDVEGIMVSSSVVRRLISNGDVETAAKCLGRYYSLHGIVTSGYHEGRKIGFPTANIDLGTSCLLAPAGGVYAVKVWLDGESESRVGMLNIGTRPTFGGNDVSIEVNIFGFAGDIYGQNIRVEFCKRIRSEHKFDNIDQLVAQLKKDKEEISKLF